MIIILLNFSYFYFVDDAIYNNPNIHSEEQDEELLFDIWINYTITKQYYYCN